ncbi:hypothetical protein FOA52_002280 [Chlamydomonas sp. UWO 241]|nr:hypothetical protein FOA52_002280 [Chlamydomonas sp. UWO 241]
MYSNFLFKSKSVEPLVEHMVQAFELAIRAMPPGVESWVWLNDFIGFGLADCHPGLAMSFIELTGTHYPERLGQLIVLDAPSIMTPVWNMVRPFVDPATHKKIRFLPNDSDSSEDGSGGKLAATLNDLMGEELVKWVLDEMAAVRAYVKNRNNHRFVLSIPVARGANWFLAGRGRRMDEEEATAAAAERIAAAAEDGTSLPVRLATDVVRFLYGGTGRGEPADGGVVSASLLNAKPAVEGIGVEPRGGGVLRVLFTVASDAAADTVVRWRHELRRCVDSTAVFDVLSDREEAQHQALWPAFLAAKAAPRPRFDLAELRSCVRSGCIPAPPSGGAGARSASSKGPPSKSLDLPGARGGTSDSGCVEGDAPRASVDRASAPSTAPAAAAVAAARLSADDDGPSAVPGSVHAPGARSGHSHYGCATLLQMYLSRPELLDVVPGPK